MKTFLRLFLSALAALFISLLFSVLFLRLTERSAADQALLVIIPGAALAYLFFSLSKESARGAISALRLKPISLPPPQEYAAGLILSLFFFAAYLHFGLQFNFGGSDTTDNFLDADNTPWALRIAAPEGHRLEMRGPHPFAYFVLRPPGRALAFLVSDETLAAILLNAFAGALCVFLAWAFMKRQSNRGVYALLIAALLGASASHFFFSAVVETYIFSAVALIGFALVAQKNPVSLRAPLAASLLTFGLTLTNFAQNFIAFSAVQFSNFHAGKASFLRIFRFTALTLSLGVVLSAVHAAWYPSSALFFQLSGAGAEGEFSVSIVNEPQWRAAGRALLLARTLLLYTVVAPRPFVFGEEVGNWLPRFNFFKIVPQTYSYAAYDGMGQILVLAWAGLLLASAALFLWDLLRVRKIDLSLAFLLCLLFNFILHLNYGYEPFLYSPDWAYALVFFVGMTLAPFSKNRLFLSALLVFILLLAWNQIQFLQFILDTIAPFRLGGG